MPVMITLNKIRAVSLDNGAWKKVYESHKHLGADTDFPLSSVLDSNGLYDTLLCFSVLPRYIKIPKHFAIWCAWDVQHLMMDNRSIDALDVAERYLGGDATREELEEAIEDAFEAASNARDVANASEHEHEHANAAYAAAFAVRSADNHLNAAYAAATYAAISHDSNQKQASKLREMLD
jgi:hypothetical protein